jgi:hypothetical protein
MHSFRRGFGLVIGAALLSCGGREAAPPKAPEESKAPAEATATPADSGPQQGDAIARLLAVMAEQDRVNQYFHRQVLPKLKDCWSDLKGEGSIAVRVSYGRYDSLWTAGEAGVNKSTLPKDEEQLALRCLAESVRGTSFPAEGPDGDATEYQVNWSLPVPWPADLAEVAKLMALQSGGGGGIGGCGGESVPMCQDCWINSLFFKFSLCVPVCNGYIDCSLEPDGNGCKMKTKCVSAPIFGNWGGFVRY